MVNTNTETREMSITRGLAELKLLDKRIKKGIHETNYIACCIGKKSVRGFNDNKDFENDVKSNYESVKDLIKQRHKIKSAIVDSNAKTIVKIAGKEMTVAEAIERKTSIEYDKMLLDKLREDYNQALYENEKTNQKVQSRLDTLLESNFGKDSKVKDSEMEAISKPFLEQNESKIIDPLKIKERIDELSKDIDEFEAEVDFCLSESNTMTKIIM